MMHGVRPAPGANPPPRSRTDCVLLAVVAVVARSGLMAGPWKLDRSRRSRRLRSILDERGELYRLKNQGTALQQAAFETDGLLPLYGSSELNLLRPYNRPFHATNLFRDRPTGFSVFPVGKQATTCLITQQKLAGGRPRAAGAEGGDLPVHLAGSSRGSRPGPGGYAGNFSPLHAGELAFNARLSLRLRQDAARRMLQYPATVADRPLLRFALENLADGSPLSLACYDAVLPLGMLHNAILRYQDHWNVRVLISGNTPHGRRPELAARRPAD